MGYFVKDEQGVSVHPPPATTKRPNEPDKRPKGYLDTCLIIGLAKGDLGPEHERLRDLLQLRKAGWIDLVTSAVVEEELARFEREGQGLQQDIYALLTDVPRVPESEHNLEHPAFAALTTVLPHLVDARHVFQAVVNGVEYFVTNDVKSIVQHAAAVQSAVGIAVRLPSQLVAEVAPAAAES